MRVPTIAFYDLMSCTPPKLDLAATDDDDKVKKEAALID